MKTTTTYPCLPDSRPCSCRTAIWKSLSFSNVKDNTQIHSQDEYPSRSAYSSLLRQFLRREQHPPNLREESISFTKEERTLLQEPTRLDFLQLQHTARREARISKKKRRRGRRTYRSSMVSFTTSLLMKTSLFCPSRWQRSYACDSLA